ncbi:DUF2931 family protein [Hafnia alvei]|uniref:DUF2931 family protein n=1 Tax=Hafnia alvei TaxID=569 RepID=UPI0007BED293|nr:DUF2931 family protein [Hafnia alvei]
MKKIILISSLSFLTACQSAVVHEKKGNANYSAPYKQVQFQFVYPYALPAVVTYATVLDTDGYWYKFNTLDPVQGSRNSTYKWNPNVGVGLMHFNLIKNLPQEITFCWDSIIDKKNHETKVIFNSVIWKKMITSEQDAWNKKDIFYYNSLVIGLAPEGKIRVWLKGNATLNILIATGQTVSGDQLTLCKGVTRFPNGYEYPEMTNEFIKGKIYPYGNW